MVDDVYSDELDKSKRRVIYVSLLLIFILLVYGFNVGLAGDSKVQKMLSIDYQMLNVEGEPLHSTSFTLHGNNSRIFYVENTGWAVLQFHVASVEEGNWTVHSRGVTQPVQPEERRLVEVWLETLHGKVEVEVELQVEAVL